MTKKDEKPFIEIVEAHERAWGKDSYPNRPSLSELLNAPVLALWKSPNPQDERLRATVHQNTDSINKHITRLVIHSRLEMPTHRLAAVYINQKKAAIRSVSVELTVEP